MLRPKHQTPSLSAGSSLRPGPEVDTFTATPKTSTAPSLRCSSVCQTPPRLSLQLQISGTWRTTPHRLSTAQLIPSRREACIFKLSCCVLTSLSHTSLHPPCTSTPPSHSIAPT